MNKIPKIKGTRIVTLIFLIVLVTNVTYFSLKLQKQTSNLETITTTKSIPAYSYKIINVYPHDTNAYTQGLVYHDGYIYEGTGLYSQSTLRKVELETGRILQMYRLPDQFFGEGITIYQNMIIMLTWQSNRGIVFELESFEVLHEFTYATEGWGITHDGTQLIMSDGSSTLYFLDPQTFQEIKRINVFDNKGPVTRLNELEYIKGEIYANIWPTNRIVRISPQTGQVLGWIILEGVMSQEGCTQDNCILNGIAYDNQKDRLFITGKLYNKIIEIELIEYI